jgi:large subunit ribosomal protein L24
MKNSVQKSNKFHIRKGDTVKVLAGNDKGKTGKVLEIIPAKRRALVEGINMVTKHTKPSANNPNGGIQKMEAAIHLSNLMLVDPSTGDATRVGRKLNEAGKLQRYSKKTGEFIKNA